MKLSVVAILLLISVCSLFGQNYTPVESYYLNGTPIHGVKIKTEIPFVNGWAMPTVIIEGYSYGTKNTMSLMLTWYVWNADFYYPKMSSSGGYTPEVILANEDGKIVIFINDLKYYQRFTIRAYAAGQFETEQMFSNWIVVDEPIAGTVTKVVPYENRFAGDVFFRDGIRLEGHNPIVRLNDTSSGSEFYIVSNGSELRFSPSHGAFPANYMVFDSSGNLGLGTADPSNKLEVNGTIRSKEVIVETGWSDFVFEDGYELRSLDEVESHIAKHGHLPDVPSASVVESEGLSVGEAQKIMMQKIEELTLYAIEQNKRIESLAHENQDLKKRLTRQEALAAGSLSQP